MENRQLSLSSVLEKFISYMKLLEALSELSHREERKFLDVTSLHNTDLWDKC